MDTRIGFVTCVELGFSCIREIYRVGGTLDCVITLDDQVAPNKSGRVSVDGFCEEHGISLAKVRKLNSPESLQFLRSRHLDWLFIVGWSQIASDEVLSSTRRGAIGMHPTLLPAGRGRASIPWAILKGLPETGVTMFKIDSGVDTGPIVGQVRIPMSKRETATELYHKVTLAHRQLIAETWQSLVECNVQLMPQDESLSTYWPGRTPRDGALSLDMLCEEADCLIRATTSPYPGAYLDVLDERLRIWAGHILDADGHVPAGARLIRFRDGTLVATSFTVESI